jgi:putative membrane protein
MYAKTKEHEAYNGQQGDYWDAQKDMALALLGALVMLALLQFGKKKNGKAQQQGY